MLEADPFKRLQELHGSNIDISFRVAIGRSLKARNVPDVSVCLLREGEDSAFGRRTERTQSASSVHARYALIDRSSSTSDPEDIRPRTRLQRARPREKPTFLLHGFADLPERGALATLRVNLPRRSTFPLSCVRAVISSRRLVSRNSLTARCGLLSARAMGKWQEIGTFQRDSFVR